MRLSLIHFFAFFFISLNTFGFDFCSGNPISAEFPKIRSVVDQKISVFANKKGIAELADTTLSNLIAARSPLIINWIAMLNQSDENQIARQWRLYFLKNYLLPQYPTSNLQISSGIEKMIDEIITDYQEKAFVNRMEELFRKAKAAAINTVTVLKPLQKPLILDRVQSIKLYWPKDLKSSVSHLSAREIIDWGIAYDPKLNVINMGLNAHSYPNDETFLAVFAHEIAHSFDSCRWSNYFQGPWPFEKIGICLRDPRSVGARNRDNRQLSLLENSEDLNVRAAAQSLRKNETCNRSFYPPEGLQADQMAEAFADWFSAEVLARMKDIRISQMRADLCDEGVISPASSYPSNHDRLFRIYFAHPLLRAGLGLRRASSATYCRF